MGTKKPAVPAAILREALEAYADAVAESNAPAAMRRRRLQWPGTPPLTLAQFREVAGRCCPCGYNRFDAARVADAIELLKVDVRLCLARECSVAIYVTGETDALTRVEAIAGPLLLADEHGLAEPGKLRLWWD